MRVDVTEYPDARDPGPPGIPPDARIEGGNDDPVLGLHQGACGLDELYRAHCTDGRWTTGAIARFDLRTNPVRPRGWTSADQAGLPLTAGLARHDEVVAGEIRHALRVNFARPRRAGDGPEPANARRSGSLRAHGAGAGARPGPLRCVSSAR